VVSLSQSTRQRGSLAWHQKGIGEGKVDENMHRLDAVRKRSSELDNHLIDEYAAGRLSRRAFIRRGTVMGM